MSSGCGNHLRVRGVACNRQQDGQQEKRKSSIHVHSVYPAKGWSSRAVPRRSARFCLKHKEATGMLREFLVWLFTVHLIRNRMSIGPGLEQSARRYGEECVNQFSKLASASRTWQVSGLVAALTYIGFIPRGSAKAVGD
jgi:hypothetical protein